MTRADVWAMTAWVIADALRRQDAPRCPLCGWRYDFTGVTPSEYIGQAVAVHLVEAHDDREEQER